jgi:hypothetical protein
MLYRLACFIFLLSLGFNCFSQDFFKERIWKLEERKKSVFLRSGVFHAGSKKVLSDLNSTRGSYVSSRGYERLVFDFSTDLLPFIYGFISKKDKKLYLDFFNTRLSSQIDLMSRGRFVEKIKLYKINSESLTLEVNFKESVILDVFYLSSPSRLVVDIKKD